MEVGISFLMAFEILNIGIVFFSARSTAPVHSHLQCMILVADPSLKVHVVDLSSSSTNYS